MGVLPWQKAKAEHALSFSDTSVSLLRRDPAGPWVRLDRAPIETGHLRAAMVAMRASLPDGDAPVHLFLPAGHVLSASFAKAQADEATAQLAAKAGCPPDSLATVIRRTHDADRVTAFAADRTTIGEAVAHAAAWGFRPVSVGVHPDTTPDGRPVRFSADLPPPPYRPLVLGAAAATALLVSGLTATLALLPASDDAVEIVAEATQPPSAQVAVPPIDRAAAPTTLPKLSTPLPARPVAAPAVARAEPQADPRPDAKIGAVMPGLPEAAPTVARAGDLDRPFEPQGLIRLTAVTRQMPPSLATPRAGTAPSVTWLPDAPAEAPQAATPAPVENVVESTAPQPEDSTTVGNLPPVIEGPVGIRPTPRPADIPLPAVVAVPERLSSPRPVARPEVRVQRAAAPPPVLTRGTPAPAQVATSATLPGALPQGQALLGIIARDGQREALLRTADGRITRVTQGDTVGEWRVGTIDERTVRLVGNGGGETLSLPGG